MPCPFTGPKTFCTGPSFLSQPKNLTAFSASSSSGYGQRPKFVRDKNSATAEGENFGPTLFFPEQVLTKTIFIFQAWEMGSIIVEENEEPSAEDLLNDLDYEMANCALVHVHGTTVPNRIRQLLAKIAFKVHKEKEPCKQR